jgi:hypothetical protein
LSKVTDVALLELQVSVVDDPRVMVVGFAVSVNVGGLCGGGVFDFVPEQATKLAASNTGVARRTTFIRVQLAMREGDCGAGVCKIIIEAVQSPGMLLIMDVKADLAGC